LCSRRPGRKTCRLLASTSPPPGGTPLPPRPHRRPLGLCRISRSGGRPGRRERRRRPGRGRGDDGSGGSGRAHRPRRRTPPGGGRISPGANPAAAA
jgi:hypothetical protein